MRSPQSCGVPTRAAELEMTIARTSSGWLAASLLLLSVYPATEIYIRGDLSEFCAMMLIPPALWEIFLLDASRGQREDP